MLDSRVELTVVLAVAAWVVAVALILAGTLGAEVWRSWGLLSGMGAMVLSARCMVLHHGHREREAFEWGREYERNSDRRGSNVHGIR